MFVKKHVLKHTIKCICNAYLEEYILMHIIKCVFSKYNILYEIQNIKQNNTK